MEELINLLESSKHVYYLGYYTLSPTLEWGWIHNKPFLYKNWKPLIERLRDAWLKTKMER